MMIPSDLVGRSVGPRRLPIDARWAMAYAAGLGETAAEYFDTTRPGGIVVHPLFPVCYEWPLASALRSETLTDAITARSVHATHDLRLHRRPRADEELQTTATVVAVEPRSPGAYVVTRLETLDADGSPVSTTDYGSIYRGVRCEGADASGAAIARAAEKASTTATRAPDDVPEWSTRVTVAATLAHVYTECARIWNPIHTDRAFARAAGLPDIILHGTATLALAVSTALAQEGLGPDTAVGRIRGRFTGMVPLPSTLVITGRRLAAHGGEGGVAFRVLTPDGRTALTDGCLVVTSPSSTETPR